MNVRTRAGLVAALLSTSCASPPPEHHISVEQWEQLRSEAREEREASAPLQEDAALSDLLLHARLNHPGLEAAFEHWRAALERVPQATKMPEPRLTFAAYAAEIETRVGPTRARVNLTQPLPRYGELEAAGARAMALAEVARVELEALRLEVDAEVRDAWYERVWLAEALAVGRGHQDLLVHWEAVARARLESGIGAHADVIQAQVELGKLEDRVQSLDDLQRPAEARLNAALGRDARAPLPASPAETPAFVLPREERLRDALGESPELRTFAHRIEAARQAIELAETSSSPRWSVGADYTLIDSARQSGVSGSGQDALALLVGLDLPIWRSAYAAAVREQESNMRGLRMQQRARHDALASQLEMTLYQLRDADRRARLYRESLIPKGEEAVRALDAGYQSGEASFLALVDAQRALLEFQLEAARAETDRARALARSERITGTPLHEEL